MSKIGEELIASMLEVLVHVKDDAHRANNVVVLETHGDDPDYDDKCMLDSIRRGEAPINPRKMLSTVLDPNNPNHEKIVDSVVRSWIDKADALVVYRDKPSVRKLDEMMGYAYTVEGCGLRVRSLDETGHNVQTSSHTRSVSNLLYKKEGLFSRCFRKMKGK